MCDSVVRCILKIGVSSCLVTSLLRNSIMYETSFVVQARLNCAITNFCEQVFKIAPVKKMHILHSSRINVLDGGKCYAFMVGSIQRFSVRSTQTPIIWRSAAKDS